MATDTIYIYDKQTKKRSSFGEIQCGFNMSQVIDGTKDSWQIEVFNFIENELEPNTIVKHKETNTWWVVKSDKSKRYANESSYWYVHNITLVGAIDLLNNRDLTDCGFNTNTYTVDSVIKRIIKLSTFEYNISVNYFSSFDKNKSVDYVKTYENYTPLSALRDFLNGYNCDIKLTFSETQSGANYYLGLANFNVISKSGRLDLDILNGETAFKDIREIKSANKESYGTTVISNAQNVISTQAKTYPLVGGVALTGDDYNTTLSSAFIKLPSPAYKVNWVRAIVPQYLVVESIYADTRGYHSKPFYPQNRQAYDREYDRLIDILRTLNPNHPEIPWLEQYREQNYLYALACSTLTFYNNPKYNPSGTYGSFVLEDTTPYIPELENSGVGSSYLGYQVALMDKESAQLVRYPMRTIQWDRGSDKITNLEAFGTDGVYWNPNRGISGLYETGLPNYLTIDDSNFIFYCTENENTVTTYNTERGFQHIDKIDTLWQVNYVPMTDLKVKIDNDNTTLDSKLYNQNGKMTDSYGLSKLLSSYAKEIEKDTITRYMQYTSYSNIPVVGQRVRINNDIYVINNISYDFNANETDNNNNVGYYIDCEFTLSKYVTTKSIMTNPNTNIRDYGIPQKYNVKRRQVYRDYFEFDLNEDETNDPYVDIAEYIDTEFTDIRDKRLDHTAIIRTTYNELVDGSLYWYYQLNSTVYLLKNALFEVIDFNDNNIIGYDCQNTVTGFNMSNWFSINGPKVVTTPVSYVDSVGQVKDISLAMLTQEELGELYDDYLQDQTNYNGLISQHVFVSSDIYEGNTASTQTETIVVEQEKHNATIDTALRTVTTFTMSYSSFVALFPVDTPIFTNSAISNISIQFVDEDNVLFNGYLSSGTITIDTQNSTVSIAITSFFNPLHLPDHNKHFDISATFSVSYEYAISSYLGAKDRTNFVIQEINYNKDATEVPVFEYSLQLGGNQNVELVDNLLNTDNALFITYGFAIVNKDTMNEQIASQVNVPLEVYDCAGSSDYVNYDFYMDLRQENGVHLVCDSTEMELQLEFFNLITMSKMYGKESTSFKFTKQAEYGTQLTASDLIGKDIVITRNMVKGFTYDSGNDDGDIITQSDVLFVIHNITIDNFVGNKLIIKINHYRLN